MSDPCVQIYHIKMHVICEYHAFSPCPWCAYVIVVIIIIIISADSNSNITHICVVFTVQFTLYPTTLASPVDCCCLCVSRAFYWLQLNTENEYENKYIKVNANSQKPLAAIS